MSKSTKPFGVLGVGQCGGNIAEIAAQMGYQTAIINTNQDDADPNNRVEHKFFVPGHKGAGQNRDIGIQAVKDYLEEMVQFVQESFADIRMLIVAFSTDGGTGSGVSPILIDVLTQALPHIHIAAMPILPEESVVAGNRINSTNAIAELSGIDALTSVFMIDNEQVRKQSPQGTRSEIYTKANLQAMRAIDKIVQTTTKASHLGNFDEEDMMNVLATRGLTMISTAIINDCRTQDDVTNVVAASWLTSCFAPIDSKGILRAAVIYEGPEKLTRSINLPSIFKKIGEPLQLFEGTYVTEGDATVTTVLAGMSFPQKRLKAMEENLEQNKERLLGLVSKTRTQNYTVGVDWAMGLKNSATPVVADAPPKVDISSRLDKYGSKK